MLEEILTKALIGLGPIGLVIALMGYFLWRTIRRAELAEKKLHESEERRIQDSKAFTERALYLTDKFMRNMDKIRIMAETLVNRQDGRRSFPSFHSDPPDGDDK